jgi:DNA-binding response OmpR family regulator
VAELDFRSASVLLFDPVGPNLLATRSILTHLGFSRIDTARDFNNLVRRLSEGAYDLVVAEVTDAGGNVCEIVRRLRAGEISGNPFTVVILTSWERSAGGVRGVVDAGSDDILLRPFSPSALEERIVTFASTRKPFVVTSDYIGPDRRSDAKRPSSAAYIEAPNSLKAVATGDSGALERHHQQVVAARNQVERERLRRLAMRLSAAAHLQATPGADGDKMTADEIDTAARELHQRLKRTGRTEALEIASTLCEVIAKVRDAGDATPEQLELMRDLPLGVYAALEGDVAADRARGEIDAVLKKIRTRFANTEASSAPRIATRLADRRAAASG